MKLFSTQLVAKSRIPGDELESSGCDLYPSLQLWLKVVGLSPTAIEVRRTEQAPTLLQLKLCLSDHAATLLCRTLTDWLTD